MILYAEIVSRWNSFSSDRKLDRQKINNDNNKHIQRKNPIVLYAGTNNGYIRDYFYEFCGIWMAEFKEEVVQRSTKFKDKNMFCQRSYFLSSLLLFRIFQAFHGIVHNSYTLHQ